MSNLFQKASIITTPTAYDNGKLLSVKPVKTFGSELIINGTFDTDSDWNKGTGWTISDGKASLNNSTGSLSKNDGVLEANKTYLVSIEITSITLGKFSPKTNTGQNIFDSVTLNTIGVHESVFTNTSGVNLQIRASGTTTGSIDNVSVKEVIDADFQFSRNSSATRVNSQGLIEDVQILSSNLVQNGDFSEEGSELVTNGGFDTDSDWHFIGTTNISNGVANFPDNTNSFLIQDSVVDLSVKIYKIQYEVITTNGSNFRLAGGNSAFGTVTLDSATIGVKTFYLQSNGTVNKLQFNNNQFIGSIDNVSVKEVGQNWTFGTGWSIGDGKAVFDGFSNVSLKQDGIVANNKKYKLTYTILDYVQGGLKWRFGLSSNLTPVRSANGTYVEEITATGSDFRAITDGATKLSIDNISVIEITEDTDLPRINYTNGEGSLLLEPQSTNLITYSEDYSDSSWVKNQITQSGNSIVSPDGSVNASLITTTSSIPFLATFLSLTTGNTYTISCFVKKGTNRFVRLAYVSSGVTAAWFDLENNVVGTQSSNSTSASIESYGNDWYRITNTITSQQASGNVFIGLSDSDNGTSSTQVGNTVYVWGFQVEELSYATSYIPTNGSTVTRLADVCNNAGSSDLINSTEGVLYVEISALANDGTVRYFGLNDGSNNNRAVFLFDSTANRVRAIVSSGGTKYVDFNYTVSDLTEFHKIALKYKANDFALWIDGTERNTDTSGLTPIGLDNLEFDLNLGGAFYGNVKCVAVFKEALSDTELTCLTS